nr:hypothetical protein [Muribaculaceae bacterium]
MKKLYAFAAAALFAVLPLSAQKLTFYMGEKPVENGSKVEFKDIEVEDFGDGLGMITMDPNLTLVSDINTSTVKVTAECTSGQSIQLCAGGQCENGKKIVKEGVILVAGQKLPLLFEYMDMMWDPTTPVPTDVTAEISAVDAANPKTAISFTIVMNPKNSEVKSVFLNDKAFRAVKGGIEYTFDAPAAVAIYNLNGEAVVKTTLNGQGTL